MAKVSICHDRRVGDLCAEVLCYYMRVAQGSDSISSYLPLFHVDSMEIKAVAASSGACSLRAASNFSASIFFGCRLSCMTGGEVILCELVGRGFKMSRQAGRQVLEHGAEVLHCCVHVAQSSEPSFHIDSMSLKAVAAIVAASSAARSRRATSVFSPPSSFRYRS